MQILNTDDGSCTLLSETYGVSYHSKYGAVTESGHVFINAGLRYKAAVQRQISVLETGLGTGLNAFMTFLEAERRNLIVEYTGLELFPLGPETFEALHYPDALQAPEHSADFLKIHLSAWESPIAFSENFSFSKSHQSIEHFRTENAFDVIYFDAFAPQEQPELWTEAVFANMFASLKPEGVLVTYCAQGAFKRTLKKVGFTVERLQGPPGKREMTRAVKEPKQ